MGRRVKLATASSGMRKVGALISCSSWLWLVASPVGHICKYYWFFNLENYSDNNAFLFSEIASITVITMHFCFLKLPQFYIPQFEIMRPISIVFQKILSCFWWILALVQRQSYVVQSSLSILHDKRKYICPFLTLSQVEEYDSVPLRKKETK